MLRQDGRAARLLISDESGQAKRGCLKNGKRFGKREATRTNCFGRIIESDFLWLIFGITPLCITFNLKI